MLQLEYKIGDCLGFMKEYPDNYFDLIVTDPPYGIGETNERRQSRHRNQGYKANAKLNWNSSKKAAPVINNGHYDWDNKPLTREYFDEMKRISKNQIIFGGNYYLDYLGSTPCLLVWDKDNGASDFSDCELAWTSFTSAVRKFKYRWNGMLQEDMKKKEKRVYTSQKPVALFRWILENYAEPGFRLCDPFCGSGPLMRAARELGMHCTCFDINPECEQIIIEKAMLNTPSLESFA